MTPTQSGADSRAQAADKPPVLALQMRRATECCLMVSPFDFQVYDTHDIHMGVEFQIVN